MAEPDGKVLTLTLTSDDKYSLWVYSDGKAAYAIWHATAPK